MSCKVWKICTEKGVEIEYPGGSYNYCKAYYSYLGWILVCNGVIKYKW